MSKHREYPPYISYLIATVMSVSLIGMQATLPFKVQALHGDLGAVGFLFTFTSLIYVITGLSLGWISQHAGPRRVMLTALLLCSVAACIVPSTTKMYQVY